MLSSVSSTAAAILTIVAVVVAITFSTADASSFANHHRGGNFRSTKDLTDLRRAVREKLHNNRRDSLVHETRRAADASDDTKENTKAGKATQQDKVELLEKLLGDSYAQRKSEVEPENVVVNFGLSIVNVRYDNDSGIATAAVWERMSWKDSRWTWSPEQFGGITSISLSTYNLWKPDIELLNSATSYTERSQVNALVSSDGSIFVVPRAVYQTFCSADYSSRQVTCDFKIGSWTYDGTTVGLSQMDVDESSTDVDGWSKDAIDVTVFDENCGAVLTNQRARLVKKYYACCGDTPYPSIEVQITFTPRGW